ncbi:methionine ABC transporter ATP-binding protein [Hydrogenophaga sp. OTU3427]|uniref:methionine ABC transporter ATP-binding protein n=1 Tax=Hydrogenophaga sp. OTU3427 TaxID=3043856 RepID=UPI00313DB89B
MIRLEGIHQTYRGPKGPVHALRGVDLDIGSGEVFGVIGRSGAGKSSLVRTINLLNRPTQGTVTVAGRPLTSLDAAGLRAARRDIGMIFQHFNLLSSRTVYDNVALPLELAGLSRHDIRARVAPLLELVGLGALADRYPAQISGGQKQRVGIARALASRPKVLLSDEATSALDPETTRSILALLQEINRELGLTVVLITHQMQVIKQVAHRLAVMEAGQIVEQGETLQVFSQPQHEVTRSLLDDVVPQALPVHVLERVRVLLGAPGQAPSSLLRLVFAGQASDSPLLSDLVRRFGLDLNIVHGQIDEVQGHPFGSLAVLASGAREQLQAAVGHLRGSGVLVQEVAHA